MAMIEKGLSNFIFTRSTFHVDEFYSPAWKRKPPINLTFGCVAFNFFAEFYSIFLLLRNTCIQGWITKFLAWKVNTKNSITARILHWVLPTVPRYFKNLPRVYGKAFLYFYLQFFSFALFIIHYQNLGGGTISLPNEQTKTLFRLYSMYNQRWLCVASLYSPSLTLINADSDSQNGKFVKIGITW